MCLPFMISAASAFPMRGAGKRCIVTSWKMHSFYLVAEEDGFITGYGCFWFIAGEAQLVNIGVRPCCRRQGIGRMLLQKGIEEAQGRGMQTMFLEVRVSNLPAQKMYETFGFKNLGLRKKVYELPIEDGYVMERAL